MKFEELEDKIYDCLNALTDLEICWVMDNGPRPAQPYIALRLDSDESIKVCERASLGVTSGKTDLYASMAILQVNLIGSTKGAIEAFGKLINTTRAAVLFDAKEIGVFAESRAKDLSRIPTDSKKWERHHMIECQVSFLEHIDDETTFQIESITFKRSGGYVSGKYIVEAGRVANLQSPIQPDYYDLITFCKNGFLVYPEIGTDVVITEYSMTFNSPMFEVNDVVEFKYITNVAGQTEHTVSKMGVVIQPGSPGGGLLPAGGLPGQELTKIDSTDFNVKWAYSWTELTANGEFNGTQASIATGIVYEYEHKGLTIYRFISTAVDSSGYPQEDSFYSDFDGTNLTNLIITRG